MFPGNYFAGVYFAPSYFERPAVSASTGSWPWFTDYADSGANLGVYQ